MTEFDPLGVGGKMAAAGDDTHVTISGGGSSFDTTVSAMRAAGERASSSNVAADQLRAFIERVERLEEEKATIADDIKDVFGEAKSMGFDTKVMRAIIRIRKKDISEHNAFQDVLDTYLAALGMLPEGDYE
jgi:uncharacterized protein (UPF0335 family)